MALSHYHQNYGKRLSTQRRAEIKERELRQIFTAIHFTTHAKIGRVAVLGCADRRHVRVHQRIFENCLSRPVQVTTFDITTEHLAGEKGVVRHDVTKPIPGGPYDITFGHVLLKFIATDNQWSVLQNSYNALRSPGLAIHVFDEEDLDSGSARQPDGRYSVPLAKWEQKLVAAGIKYKATRWHSTVPDAPGVRGASGGALILLK